MPQKKLTLQIIPNDTQEIKTYSFAYWKVKFFIALVLVVILLTVGLISFSGKIALQLTTTSFLKQANDRLFLENQQLRSALSDLDSVRVIQQKIEILAQTYLDDGLVTPPKITLPEKPPLVSDEQVNQYLTEMEAKLKGTSTKDSRPSIKPVIGIISQKFDNQDSLGSKHSGIDIAASLNDPVYATAPGVVLFSGWKGDYGITVVLDHGNGVNTLYSHLNRNVVKKGDYVERGQSIGVVGMTGNTSGPHLHYEVSKNKKTLNPEDFFLK